ncbi:unnamed protein product [Dovyalis caffra]|uniref:FAR1 domain-containing protein n=1 Tax=Dovyalis caffra TaxID=77055 RepID=A0AAV1RYN8_9ROSI|nr:unnamed protein product [Dovyalis caffra]
MGVAAGRSLTPRDRRRVRASEVDLFNSVSQDGSHRLDMDDFRLPASINGVTLNEGDQVRCDDANFSRPDATGPSSLPDDGVDFSLIEPPYDGKTFCSLQEMNEYLQSYAKAIGFQWRTRSSRKDKNNSEIRAVRMVCNKEGVHRPRGNSSNYFRASRREGCAVAVSSTLQNHGQWKINKIQLQHCHEIDLNAIPLHLQQHLLALKDRPGNEEEREEEEEEEEEEGKPYDGQTFGSFAEMIQYLYAYAKAIGFTWRIRSSRKDKTGEKIRAIRMICSKEKGNKQGKWPNSQNEGCDVNISSTLQKDGQWKINKSHLQHRHEIDPNATPIFRRRYLLALSGNLGTEEEEEKEEGVEEEEKEMREAGNPSLSNGIDLLLDDPPYNGQTFGSLQELNQYLYSYAKGVGFEWRTRSSRKDETSGEICGVRMVCNKEGKSDSLRPSRREGCHVAVSSTLQKDGLWKINKINLQHSHEIDLNVRPFPRRRYRSVPPHMRYPLLLNDRLGTEGEDEGEDEEENEVEEASSVEMEQPQEPSNQENASPSIDNVIMEEQSSFEASVDQQGAVQEGDTTCQQSHDLPVKIEQQWKKLKRDMDKFLESNLDNVNQLSNMQRTVDTLIFYHLGDEVKTLTLQDVRQLLTALKDKVSCVRSSKRFAQAELENLHKENPDFSAMIDREKLALQAEESKLSELTCEEARIQVEIQKLMARKQSILSKKASTSKNVEKGKWKMAELKNTQEKFKKAKCSFSEWQNETSKVNETVITTLMDAKRLLSKLNV